MPSKEEQVSKAKTTAKRAKKGVQQKKYKIRKTLRFYKPKTLRIKSKPKYARTTAVLGLPAKFDKNSIFNHALNTEKANKLMTERNTLAFIVHNRSNKPQIKAAFQDIFNVKPKAVNTLLRADGKKKAYIRLPQEVQAATIASKMGMF